jgi:hypothetical protein
MMDFHCTSCSGFQDAVFRLRECDAYKVLPARKKQLVLSIIGDWYETALDDLVYRQYNFPTDAGMSPDEFIERAKEDGVYKETVYEYRAKYPDFEILSARFVF